MSVIWDSEPVARKPHRCEDCDRRIDPGELYLRQRVIGDDGPYTWKRCAHCRAFIALYHDEMVSDWYEGIGPDDISEWEPGTPASREHKRQWMGKWRVDGKLYPIPTAAVTAARPPGEDANGT